jgi:hypothetical protein
MVRLLKAGSGGGDSFTLNSGCTTNFDASVTWTTVYGGIFISGTANVVGSTTWRFSQNYNSGLNINAGGILDFTNGQYIYIATSLTQNGTYNFSGVTVFNSTAYSPNIVCTGTIPGRVRVSKGGDHYGQSFSLSSKCTITAEDNAVWSFPSHHIWNVNGIINVPNGITINGTYDTTSFVVNNKINILAGSFNLNYVQLVNNGSINHSGTSWAMAHGTYYSTSLTNNASGTVTYGGSGLSIDGFMTNTGTINWTGSNQTLTVSGNLSLGGTFDLAGKTILLNGAVNATLTCPVGGILGASVLQLSKAAANSLTLSGCNTINGDFITTSGILANPASPLTLSILGNVTLKSTAALGGANLTLAMNGTNKSLSLGGGILSSLAGFTFGASGQTFNYTSGTFINNYSFGSNTKYFNLLGGTFATNATFTGDDQTIYGVSTSTLAGNLTFTGTGINSISLGGNATAGTTTISQTAPGYMKLSGNSRFWNLVISAGATLDSSPDMGGTSFNLTLNNDFVKSGIFLPRAGTFIFDNTTRTKTYALSGHTFNNIGLTSADASTATTTFTGGLTFTGDLSISTYGGGAFIHTWNVATTTTFTVPGSFIMSKKGATPVFSTGVTTFNATGNNSTISIGAGVTFAAASASINLNGSGITSLLKANSTQTSGTTIINQSSGSVVLIGNSTFFHLTINPSNSIDSSPDGSTSYNTTVNGNFTNNAGSSGFVARSGTLILASTNISTNITIGGSALNNLSFIMANNCLAAGTTVSATLSDSFNIGGDLSIASTNCSTSNYTSILPSGSMTINVSGNITVTQSSTSFILGNSNLTLNMIGQSRSLTASMQLNANLNVNGDGITTISSSGMIGTGTTTINNSTGTTVLSTNSSFPNLVINPGKSISAVNGGSSYNMTITGNFVNNAGVSGFIPGSGTVTFNPNSSYLGAGNTVRIVTNNISFNNLGISCYSQGASGSTLTIVLADNINVTGNLTYSPTGSAATRNAVVSATTSISINVFGNFSYSATTVTATFGNSNITLNMQGSNSSFVVSAGTFNANVNFSGTGTTLVSKAGSTSAGTTTINQSSGGVVLNGNSIFNELILNEGTFTAGTSTATINNKLVLNNGTFNASSATTSVGADFKILSNAIFNHNNGTFNLSSSTVNQKIETEKDLTFYNLYKYVVGAYSRVLTFNSGFTFTVLGTATLKGSITANAGNTNYYKLYLNPTLNGISWNFDPRGTRDFNNLAPWYSNNINATPISNNGLPLSSASSTGDSNTIPTTGCTGAVPFCDRGYNSNWLFGSGLFAYWCGTGGNNNVSNNINWKTATNCGGSGATLSSGYQLYFDMPTSTNAIFDSSSQSSYAGVNISSAYRGTITQACPMDLKTSGYVQNGGTFVGSSDSFVTKSFTLGGGTTTAPTVMNVNGGFFMTGGIFLASTTLNVTGSFTDNKVGSAFTAGSGTVNLTGGSQTVTSVGTTTFYNLARPPGGGTLTFSAGKVFQVSNRLTLSGAQGYLLGLRSSLPGTYWNILPSNTESNRSLGFLDVKDSFNLSSTAMNAGGSSIDSGHNENWVFSIPGVTMSTYGSQLATTTIPENNGVASLMLGGAFTAIRSSSGADVAINSIKFTYTGSLPISYLKNVTLYYNTGQCLSGWTNSGLTSAGTIGQVNSTYTFASLNVPVGFSTTTCLYLGYDIQGAVSESLVGSTINFKIHNPTIDVVLDSGLATPSWFLDIPVNTKIDGASFGITDFLSLVTSDQQKNPTVFSLKNGALWKTEGLSGTPVRLTPAEMVASIPSGETSVFTVRQVPDSSPPIYRAIIEFTLSRVDPKNPSGQRYSKTFNMTATMKASPQ